MWLGQEGEQEADLNSCLAKNALAVHLLPLQWCKRIAECVRSLDSLASAQRPSSGLPQSTLAAAFLPALTPWFR